MKAFLDRYLFSSIILFCLEWVLICSLPTYREITKTQALEIVIQQKKIAELSSTIPTLALTEAETISYEAGLKQAALGTTTQLTSWVRGLRKAKKAGILPALPKSFTDPEIVWVEHRAILVRGGK